MKDGGPSFPRDGGESVGNDGMALRDWFAGQAIAGIVLETESSEKVAAWAYDLADAMLSERERVK